MNNKLYNRLEEKLKELNTINNDNDWYLWHGQTLPLLENTGSYKSFKDCYGMCSVMTDSTSYGYYNTLVERKKNATYILKDELKNLKCDIHKNNVKRNWVVGTIGSIFLIGFGFISDSLTIFDKLIPFFISIHQYIIDILH